MGTNYPAVRAVSVLVPKNLAVFPLDDDLWAETGAPSSGGNYGRVDETERLGHRMCFPSLVVPSRPILV